MNDESSLIPISEDFLADAIDLSIPEIIKKLSENSGLLENIPIGKWLFLSRDLYNGIQTAFFVKKYSAFIGPIRKEINNEKLNLLLNEIFDNENSTSQLIENIIITIDRFQNTQKADLLGKLFIQTFKNKKFTFDEYNILLFSIDSMHPILGLQCLIKYYNLHKDSLNNKSNPKENNKIQIELSNIDYSPLISSSMLLLPVGGSFMGNNLGGARINELGIKFCENILETIKTSA